MATRGFLIRFIDIGLIVLFGFLMISDIDASSRVELSGSTPEVVEEERSDEDRAAVLVRIGPTGTYSVADLSGGADAEMESVPGTVRGEALAALALRLTGAREAHEGRGLATLVLIEPHPASVVQRTIDVMDLCDRLSLPKSLRMDIQIEDGPGGVGLP